MGAGSLRSGKSMMIYSLHSKSHTTQYLRPALGFLRSAMGLCRQLIRMTNLFGIQEQGRKPSGIIWVVSLFGLGNSNYAPANNSNEVAANDDGTQRRCRSHSERFRKT